MKTAIAQFSKRKAGLYVACNLALCAMIYMSSLKRGGAISSPQLDVWLTVAALLAAIWIALLQVTILRQLLFRKSDAIWVSDKRIYFLDTWGRIGFSNLRCEEIASVTVESLGKLRRAGITARLQCGRQAAIPTWLLSESAEAVAARLRAALGVSA